MRGQGSVHYILRSGDLVLYVEGDITAPMAQSLYEHLEADVERSGVRNIFVDLSRTTYVDSTTIGTFLKLKRLMESRGGGLTMCNLHPQVRRILSTMHLLDYFGPVESTPSGAPDPELLSRIEPMSRDLLSAEYLLDAHESIVEAAPQMEKQFEGLLRALRSQAAGGEKGS